MSRAAGRKGTGRPPDPAYGSFDKGIPGGIRHADANPDALATVTQPAAAEPLEEFRGMMAHGVPPQTGEHYQREMQDHARHPYQPEYSKPAPAIIPVPVYTVERASGYRPLADASARRITVPAAGSEPAEICGQDENRSLVQLLNEDSTHNCRIGKLENLAYDAQNQVIVGGARLPAAATGYTVLRIQGPLWAVSETSSAVVISVITEYEIANAQ
jgi:hypothetical protein